MAKSLNPQAAPAPHSGVEQAYGSGPPRRNFVVGALAAVIGALVGIFPVGAGMLVFLDPILKRKASAEGAGKPLRRVSTKEAIPPDGTPIQVPVIADLSDAWNREPNQPVGGIYLRNNGGNIECLNAICPHAGCFVAYSADRKAFACPCHNSTFNLDGSRVLPSPSPRDMDKLTVDPTKLAAGEVWVEFTNYYTGKEHQEEKP